MALFIGDIGNSWSVKQGFYQVLVICDAHDIHKIWIYNNHDWKNLN